MTGSTMTGPQKRQAIGAANIRRSLLIAVGTAIGFVAIFGIATFIIGFDAVLTQFRRLSFGAIATFFVIWVAAVSTRIWRWYMLSRRMGMNVPLGRIAAYYIAGFALTTTPGRVGEAFRLWLLARLHRVPYIKSMPVLIADRVSDLYCLLSLCLIGLVSFFDFGAQKFGALVIPALIVAVVLVALASRPRRLIRFVNWGYVALGKRGKRLFAGIRRTLRLLHTLFEFHTFWATFAVALIGWALEVLMLFLILRELGAELPFLMATFIVGASLLAGALPFLPGGLGGVELAMVALLVATGVSADQALTATVVFRAMTYWAAVICGVLTLPLVLNLVRRAPAPALAS
jgi:glycosyltransferase 2 family protein